MEEKHITRIKSDDSAFKKITGHKKSSKSVAIVAVFGVVFLLLFMGIISTAENEKEEQAKRDAEKEAMMKIYEEDINYESREGITSDGVFRIAVTYFNENIAISDGYGFFRIKYTVTNVGNDTRKYIHNDSEYGTGGGGMVRATVGTNNSYVMDYSRPELPYVYCDSTEHEFDLSPGQSREVIDCGWFKKDALGYKYDYIYVDHTSVNDREETLLTLDL